MIPFTEKLYDMTEEEIEAYKNTYREQYNSDDTVKHEREVVDIFYIEYQYFQLRKSHKWVQEQYALSGDRMAIRREILMQRLRGSSNSPIDPEDIEFLISHMNKSVSDIMLCSKWRMLLYPHGQNPRKLFDEDIPYLVGVDPSAGGGGDNTAITVLNPYTLQIAAEFKSPYIPGPELFRVLVELVNTYIPKAVIIPEKNSMGIYLVQMLLESSSIRDNIYWSRSRRELEEMVEDAPSDQELKRLSEQYKKYSVYTTKDVRKAMFTQLFQHIYSCKQLINTEYIVDDLCKLVTTSTGRIEAGKGEHDDSLMSFLLCLYVYSTGDNLEYFGINKTEHPVIGVLEPDYDEHMEARSSGIEYISGSSVKTYENLLIEDTIRMEQYRKYIVSVNKNVHDEVYSNVHDSTLSDQVDIMPYFFEEINR